MGHVKLGAEAALHIHMPSGEPRQVSATKQYWFSPNKWYTPETFTN